MVDLEPTGDHELWNDGSKSGPEEGWSVCPRGREYNTKRKSSKSKSKTHTHTHACTHTHVRARTHTHTSSGLLATAWVLFPRLTDCQMAHTRQPWGEWLPGTLAVKMAIRARQVDRTVLRSHWWPWWRYGPTANSRDPRVCGERVVLTGGVQQGVKDAGLRWMDPKRALYA